MPFFRIVNFILKTEAGVDGDFDETSKDLDAMVQELIDNKLNVFLWWMCHKQDAAIGKEIYMN